MSFDSTGDENWKTSFSSNTTSSFGYDDGESIEVDRSGNIYISGIVSGLEGDTFCGETIGSLYYCCMIMKLDSSGNKIWCDLFDTGGQHSSTRWHNPDIVLDASGNVYLTAIFNQHSETVTMEHGGSDSFIRKYTSTGTPVWTNVVGNDFLNNSYFQSIYLSEINLDDDGNLFVVGSATRPISEGVATDYDDNAFLCQYTVDGDPVDVMDVMPDEGAYAASYYVNGVSVDVPNKEEIYLILNVDVSGFLPGTSVAEDQYGETVIFILNDLRSIE